MHWSSVLKANPVVEGPFTIETENHLLGSRQHMKATKYETFEEADARAIEKANTTRTFVTHNVLDRRDRVVASHKGTK